MILILLSMISTYYEPITGIDNPLPVLLYHGEVLIHIKEEPINKLRAKIGVGIWNGIILGISFGGTNLVGYGDVDWEDQPGVDIRARLFGNGIIESVIGYNNEPIEEYNESIEGYAKKHLFACIGTRLMPGLILSGGTNYNHDEDNGFDIFGNAALTLAEAHTFHLEYIMGANDEVDNRFNFGYKLQSGSMGIQFDIKNILGESVGRQLQIFYREGF
jgi:hypothetical protein